MYAVIRTGGKQYRVQAEDVIEIEKVTGEPGDVIQFPDVLLLTGDGEPLIGTPTVDGASVAAEVVEQKRGPKIIVFKKKRRNNYRRKKGHRQDLTAVRITEILTGGKAPSKAKAKPKPAAEKPAAKAKAEAPAKDKPEEKAKAEAPAKEKAEARAPTEKKAPAEKPAAKATAFKRLDAAEGKADDLKKISGVGPALEKKLNEFGIYHYRQVAALTKDDIAEIDEALNFKGRIERDDWLAQAKSLMAESDETSSD